MYLNYRQISKVTFPVYALPSDDWHSQDGLLYVNGQIVDDKNMSGETLGIRRLQTYFKDLLPLKYTINTFVALLKQGKRYYIDSAGKCFIYQKTKFCQLKYYPIKRIDKHDTYCILRLHGVNFPFTIPRPPKAGFNWAGVLHLDGLPWLLYDYADKKTKPTRRKI